jgi:hypothetical protein
MPFRHFRYFADYAAIFAAITLPYAGRRVFAAFSAMAFLHCLAAFVIGAILAFAFIFITLPPCRRLSPPFSPCAAAFDARLMAVFSQLFASFFRFRYSRHAALFHAIAVFGFSFATFRCRRHCIFSADFLADAAFS